MSAQVFMRAAQDVVFGVIKNPKGSKREAPITTTTNMQDVRNTSCMVRTNSTAEFHSCMTEAAT